MSERFVGFYTSRPFWAVEAVEPGELDEEMQRIALSHDGDTFRLKVCRDGLVLLQVRGLEPQPPFEDVDMARLVSWWSRYLEYINCLYLLLNASVLEVMQMAGYIKLSEVTRQDAIRVELEDDEMKGQNVATGSYAAWLQHGQHRSGYGLPPIVDSRFLIRSLVLSEEVFTNLIDKASVVFAQPPLTSDLASIAKSLSEFKVGNYSVSLVLAWFVTESLIDRRWREFLRSSNREYADGRKRINSDRMGRLTEGRDYTMSVVSNVLELADCISFDVLQRVDRVRRYRNKVVHQEPGFECGVDHCHEAIELSKELSLERYDCGITLDYSYGVHGP